MAEEKKQHHVTDDSLVTGEVVGEVSDAAINRGKAGFAANDPHFEKPDNQNSDDANGTKESEGHKRSEPDQKKGGFIDLFAPSVDVSRQRAKLARQAPSRAGNLRWWDNNADVNFSSRLYQSHYDYDPFAAEKEGAKGQAWFESAKDRFVMRLVTRGLLGSAGFVVGNRLGNHYDPFMVELEKTLGKGGELENVTNSDRFLHFTSGIIDQTAGRAIKGLFGEKAVRFRGEMGKLDLQHYKRNQEFVDNLPKLGEGYPRFDTGLSHYHQPGNAYRQNFASGRSLGEEINKVTLGFSFGSIGDATGREIAGYIDPNTNKSWKDKDGHIDGGKFAKSLGKSAFDIMTYRQMEDWAAALPYVYQMRAGRHLINKAHPGARGMIEDGKGGGAFEVNNQRHIVDDYMGSSVLDLHTRFVGYNFYTLMFRDAYQHLAHLTRAAKEHGLEAITPDLSKDPLETGGHVASEGIKYIAKSFIKNLIYMTPAVVPFWAVRAPQDLQESFAIHPEKGPVMRGKLGDEDYGIARSPLIKDDSKLYFAKDGKRVDKIRNMNELLRKPYDLSGNWKNSGFYNMLKTPGRWMNKGAEAFDKNVGGAIFKALGSEEKGWKSAFDPRGPMGGAGKEFANISMAYTPYMIAKSETANLWDTPEMDASIYRAIDGAADFNWNELKAGSRDVWSAISRNPISKVTHDKMYEGRGFVNSQQEAQDAKKRDQNDAGHRGFADKVDTVKKVKRDEKKTHAQTLEESLTRHAEREGNDDDGWVAREIAIAKANEQVPPEATIH